MIIISLKTKMEATKSKIVVHDVPPYLRVYHDGTVERLLGTGFAPASLDPSTSVSSKDILLHPETSLSARLYLPTPSPSTKLPLVLYFHGGAFCISSSADPLYHSMLNSLARRAQALLVSVDYRLAPEHPLPAAYHDSWSALLSLSSSPDPWIAQHADFDRVFLAGDSAGANIAHHLAIRVGAGREVGFGIRGALMVQPYFWGEEAMGPERENPVFKAVVDGWWRFVCPSEKGCDDPMINPFVDGAPGMEGSGCGRVLVCVAGNDILRERGKLYYKVLSESKWEGKAELFETEGEDHVFHIIDPTSQNSRDLLQRCADFINQG
ncbi:probable carboxylesterase 2 isoform X1 [Salvia splendens]|uniref:probable carboxylesterase 2 isoform X1 n=1 Tax=Salvia splendens TaxID=180675 RepID=UPI001C2713C8|nr:probable carboxylesterase 2 isoform X1 [Salvia splendens]